MKQLSLSTGSVSYRQSHVHRLRSCSALSSPSFLLLSLSLFWQNNGRAILIYARDIVGIQSRLCPARVLLYWIGMLVVASFLLVDTQAHFLLAITVKMFRV